MADQLRPSGVPLVTGEVVLSTPGLAGTVRVLYPDTVGMRSAEQATPAFLESLDRAGMTEQLTVEITDAAEVDGVTGSRAGGDVDMLVELPGPGTGLGQVLLYTAEDGTASWHVPLDIATDDIATDDIATDDIATDEVSARGSDRRTYRIPRAVPPVDLTEGSRGLIGAGLSKLLKLLVFPLVDPVLGRVGHGFASRWERSHRREHLRSFEVGTYRQRVDDELDVAALGAGPVLLFLHGTASLSHTAFGRIPEPLLAELHVRYGGRVIAFDHRTVSVDPTDNARALTAALGGHPAPVLDVIAHSRGGLVGRVLAEHAADLDARITVRTLIMIGTPNAGTALADRDHLGRLLDRLTNLVQLIPDNPVTDTIDVILTVLKQLAVSALGGLDGIMSMDPRGSYLGDFLNKPVEVRTVYRAVASNFEPAPDSSLLRTARDGITDFVFRSAKNDLIVPTEGVFKVPGLAGFEPADPLVFPAEAAVDHSSYWAEAAFGEKILEWLPGTTK